MNNEKIENILQNLGTGTIPQDVHKIAEETAENFSKTLTPSRQRVLWSNIMKNRITKLTAAAVIIIAVLIGINHFGLPIDGASVAFADVVRPFLTARTATFKTTMRVEGAPTQTFESMYMEPAHMRQTTAEGVIVISDLQQGKIMTLMPAQKQAMIIEMENIPEDGDRSQFNMFHEIKRRIQEAQAAEDESVEFLGEQEIDGRTAIGYYVQKSGVDITIWADPETKMPIRFEVSNGPVINTISDIVFDVELDKSLFDLEIPEGYTVRTMRVDASKPTEKDLFEMFRIWTEHMDGGFPSTLEARAQMEFVKYQRKKMKEKGQETTEQNMLERQKNIMKMSRGGRFVQELPAESDWHYAGKDVKFGDANTAIFWYRPEGSETYHVVYADLSVEDIVLENLPVKSEKIIKNKKMNDKEKLMDKTIELSSAKLSPDERSLIMRMLSLNENDLIKGLGVFLDLSSGKYPSKLDAKTTIKETDGLGENWKMSKSEKKEKAQDIFFAAAYYEKLVREKKDVAYYGDKVTVEDSDKILIRWKLSENKYRVVFGDLTAENVTAEKLAELEKLSSQ